MAHMLMGSALTYSAYTEDCSIAEEELVRLALIIRSTSTVHIQSLYVVARSKVDYDKRCFIVAI